MSMLKGAIFDHDGLMFDTEVIWQKNWQKVASEMGITLPEEFKHDICGTSGQLMLNVIQKYYQVADGNDIRNRVVEGVHHDSAIHLDEKTGLRQILDMFRKHGVKMAVASSSPKEMLLRNLRNAGVEEYFEVVVSGTEVAHGKPAPDIFIRAAEQLGLKNEDCYVFEDAFNGVKAGVASGSKTIMIPDLLQPNEEMKKIAYAICSTLSEASERIEKGEL